MARYPSSQFILVDNTNTTASVPVATTNPAAPTYLTTFRSPKGPEEIRQNISGPDFYNLYGSQSKILFSKYGQPLLQASMDINAGAYLIAKRAVLDDAKLANATLALVVSYKKKMSKDGKEALGIVVDKDADTGTVKSKTLTFLKDNLSDDEYEIQLKPIVISIPDLEETVATGYPNSTITVSAPNSDDIVYDESKSFYTNHKNYISDTFSKGVKNVSGTYDKYSIKLADHIGSSQIKYYSEFTADTQTETSLDADGKTTFETVLIQLNDESEIPVIRTKEEFDALIKNPLTPTGETTSADMSDQEALNKLYNTIYSNTTTSCIIPLFTIFDNGRGASTKSISILQDVSSSKTLKKAVYTLKVTDYATNKTLETFAFTIDPYTRNNNTGYTFDIESAVNFKSNQITAKMYDDAYDVLCEIITEQTNEELDSSVFLNYDCIFGHTLSGESKTSIGSYLTVDATSEKNNLNKINEFTKDMYTPTEQDQKETKEIYWFYPYKKMYKLGTTELLRFGHDGGFNIKSNATDEEVQERIAYKTVEKAYQEQYRRFFYGTFDKDIFNVDVLFPTCVFDANYDADVKLAIQKLSAFRGDFLAYMDMNTNVTSYSSLVEKVPEIDLGTDLDLNESNSNKPYIRDMHNAVTCIYYDIRDPYTNKRITVTGTYGLSIVMVGHYISGVNKPFMGKGNGITFGGAIDGSVNFIPKVFPTSDMTSLNNIGNVYISDDETITNEKQKTNDLRVNYGSYYDGLFVMETGYTLNPTESEFSYINNVMLVNKLIQDIRKECPSARYNFIDGDDLIEYENAVNVVLTAYRSSFASLSFRYIRDENSVNNKIFYAAIDVVFRPFTQAEVFTITALNYSTLESNITTA